MSIVLASLGIGSVAMGRWIQTHKETFLAIAISLMALSLFTAVREKKRTGKNTGLITFAMAFAIAALLLSYTKIRYGYFI